MFEKIQKFSVGKLFVICASLLIGGCGGGGDGGAPGGGSFSWSQLQGRWESTVSDQTGRWMPPPFGGTVATLWLLAVDNSFLTVVDTNISGGDIVSAKGTRYRFDPLSSQPIAPEIIDWSGPANLNTNPRTISFYTGPSLRQTDSLTTQSLQNVIGADWVMDSSVENIRLKISSTGLIVGDSNRGCTYDGSIKARPDVTMYDVLIEQTCRELSGDVITQMSGIGFVNQGIDQLTLALVVADRSKASVWFFNK